MPPLEYASKYDITNYAASAVLGDVEKFAAGTLVDVATTLWNSLPFTPEVKTEDILQQMDQGTFDYFRENPDSVRTASLIGGTLIPGIAGLKMLDRMRRGVVSAGYAEGFVGGSFAGTKQKVLATEIANIFKQSGAATAEYRSATRQLYASAITQQVIDNAVIEVAVIGALNAHPYLEDYWKDPLKNFALGTTIGSLLGGAIAVPYTRRLIMDATGNIARESLTNILESGYKQVDEAFTSAGKFQIHTSNIKILDDVINDPVQYPITREIAGSYRLQEAAARETALENAAPWVKKSTPEVKQAIVNLLSDPKFIGVDKIRSYDLDKSIQETARLVEIEGTGTATALDALTKAITGVGKEKIAKNFITPDGKAAIAFVRLSTGEVFAAQGARNAAWAVDIKDIAETLRSRSKEPVNLYVPTKDFAEENLLRSTSAARIDSKFLKELVEVDKLKDTQVPYIAVAPDDLARQNALVAMMQKMSPEDRVKLNIKVTTDFPTYVQQQQYVTNVLEKTVAKDYSKRLLAATESMKLDFRGVGISKQAEDMLQAWIHGAGGVSIVQGIAQMRRAFDALFRGTALPAKEAGNERIADEIWKAGTKYRAELKKIADADGYVYLYRGIRGNVKGHAAVESYSAKQSVAQDFSTGFGGPGARLFRVHIDNVIGTVGSGSMREAEILVASPHQQIVNNIPIDTGVNRPVHIPDAGGEVLYDANKLLEHYTDETERQVRSMLANKNFSYEEISARTNTTVDTVRGLSVGARLAEIPFEWRRYTDAAKIPLYLDPKNKLYAVFGNPVKNPMAESFANLDYRQQRIAHTEIVEQMTTISGSEIANRTLDIYRPREMQMVLDNLLKDIGEINNQIVGDPRWQSADNALRRLKVGPTLTYVGKQITDQVDAMKKDFLEPIASAMLPLRDKPTALAEFNVVVNKLASLRGWRDVVLDETTGKYTIMQMEKVGNKMEMVAVKDVAENTFIIQQQEVVDALQSTRRLSGELYRMHNLNRAITGQGPLNDLGFYLPPISLVNKSFAFVIDNTAAENVRLLVANNADELGSLMQAFKGANTSELNKLSIVTKGDQEFENLAKGYTDYEAHTTYANVAYKHRGASALAVIPSDFRMVENMLQGYENLILQGSRKFTETYLNDVTGWLDKLSYFYQRNVRDQPKFGPFKESTKDAARTVKNIILGRDQLEQSVGLKQINTLTDFLLNRAGQVVNASVKSFTGDKLASREYFNKLETDLKAIGVNTDWSFDTYLATTRAEAKNLAPQIVSTGNGLMATLMLRVLETGQAAINIMSLPILTWSALMERLPGTVINASGDTMKFPLRVMYDGIRHMNSPMGKEIEEKLWVPKGFINQTVRQYTEIVGSLKSATTSNEAMDRALNIANKIQENTIVKDYLAKPADWAENFTRSFAMHTGYIAAKHAYPGIDNTAATIAAAAFTDRAIGNYHASQRPTAFQGTLGAAIGLFQTYFLTFAQHIYRGLEDRNFKQLAVLAMTQAGMFGINSWPGYNMLSEQVISRFNDKHWDLTTGTYRAVGDPAAEMILYGLPSSLGPAFYTRGDISPRIPSTMTEIAIFNGIKEGWNAAHQVVKKTAQGLGEGTPVQSLFEALSLQSLNRPIARWSELVTGASVTRQGNTISPAAEVWTPTGVFARLLATRPIEEQVVRNARHLNQFYEQVDFERRQELMNKIKTSLRDGTLNDSLLSNAALEYVRFGGSARGWRGALNEAMVKSEEGTRLDLLRKLEPDSPLQVMLQDLY